MNSTRAPQIRAMQIIADLEGIPQGAQDGTRFVLRLRWVTSASMAIWTSLCPHASPLPSDGRGRTLRAALLKDGKAYVQAGGGWVNDSEPEAEFQETVNKIKAIHPPQ